MKNQTKPTWVKVIGVLGIIFGIFGILGATQTMIMPMIMDFQRSFFDTFKEGIETLPTEEIETMESQELNFAINMQESVFSMFDMPAWYGTAMVIFGVLQLIIAGLYLLSFIFFIQLKPFSLRMVYWVLGLSMALALAQIITGLIAGSFMGVAMSMNRIFSLVINGVFLAVILSSDKSRFYPDSLSDTNTIPNPSADKTETEGEPPYSLHS